VPRTFVFSLLSGGRKFSVVLRSARVKIEESYGNLPAE
jgi:hypothetical protein